MSVQPTIGIGSIGTPAGLAASIADIRRRLTQLEVNRTVIGPGSLTGEQLASGTITATQLLVGSITAEYIQAGAINAGHIQANSISADHIQADAIHAEHIAAKQIKAEHIDVDSINADHIQANTITAVHITADSIDAGHIKAGSIDADLIKADAINAGHIQAGSIEAGHIVAGAIDTVHLAAESITADQLQVSVAMADQIVAVMSVTGSGVFTEGLQAISANMGTLTSGTIEGATIRTAGPTQPRWEANNNGMMGYRSDGLGGLEVVMSFENSTGNLFLKGQVFAEQDSILPVAALAGEIGGINLVVNSAFENTGVGGGFKNWSSQAGSSDVITLGTGAFWGTKVMRATNIPGLCVRDNVAGKAPASPGRWYVLSWMAKTVNGGGTSDIRITWYDAAQSGTTVTTIGDSTNGSGTVTLTNKWQRVWLRAKAPAVSDGSTIDAYFARFGPRLTTTTPSSYAYADAVMFSEGERPLGFNLRTDEIQPGAINDGTLIAASTIVGNHILAGEITTTHLSATSITALELTAGNARLGMLKANAVDAVSIQAGAINTQHLSVTTWPLPQLANGNWRNLVGYTAGTDTLNSWPASSGTAPFMSVDTAASIGYAIKFTHGATSRQSFVSQSITLPKGRHVISALVWNDYGSGTYGGLNASVVSGTVTLTIPPAPAGSAWVLQEMVADVSTATAVVSVRAQLGIGGNATGTLWVGPISVQSSVTGTTITPSSIKTAHLNITTGGGNMIADSSFEQSITGIINSNAAQTFTNPSTPKPGTGSKSFRWFSSSGAATTEVRFDDTRAPKVENGRTYTFSAWVSQTSGGAAGRRVRVKALMRDGAGTPATLGTQFVGDWVVLDSPSGAWVRPKVTFTTNAATVDHVLLYVSVEDVSGGGVISSGESFWTDAWQLEEGDVVTAWTPFLDATKIDGGTITAGTLQTATSGGRLVVGFNPADSTLGMSVYNSDGTTKNIEILGSGTNAGRITMRNLRFVDAAGAFENIEWYKTDNVTRIASVSAGSSGSTGVQAYTYAGASDANWKSIFGFIKNSRTSWLWVDETKVQVASSINTNPHANMRTLLGSNNWSEYSNTHGGSNRFGPVVLPEGSTDPIDLPLDTYTGEASSYGGHLYYLSGKRDNGGHSSMVVLVNYAAAGGGVILKIAEHQFPGFGATGVSISGTERRVRLQTNTGVGSSTWYCTRISFNPWAF